MGIQAIHYESHSARGLLKGLAAFILLACALSAVAQQTAGPVGVTVPLRYLVLYRPGSIPTNASPRMVGNTSGSVSGVQLLHVDSNGIGILQGSADLSDAATLAALRAQPNVEYAVHDRIVSAHSLRFSPVIPATIGIAPPSTAYDTYYRTPQSWAVQQSGGYGAGVPGGAAHGPWDTTLGIGARIAVLDSGVDQNHPDLKPNLIFNLSEIDQSALTGVPSGCDDGSAQDQQGHGSWTASLAAGAMGPGTGLIIGVAPSAALLNIKVLERLPDPSSTAPDLATQCASGQASGMLSWVIQGIDDAVAQHASVISMSLGVLVDLETGEGAGLQAIFNQATYAATQAGAVVIASAGNDGVDLSNPRYIELPAQSRNVLAVVASTNPACAEDLTAGATCVAGPVTLPYYSNFGAPLNAIAAPGGSYPDGADTAVSGWVRGACSMGLTNTADGPPADSAHSLGCFNLGHTQYVQAMGTSASAALVAGATALLQSTNPTWPPAQVIAALRSAATPSASLPAAPQLQ